jgi:hypothetical protein
MIGDFLLLVLAFAGGAHLGHKYGGPLALWAKAKALLQSLKG